MDQTERIENLKSFDILDTPNEAVFDNLVEMTLLITGCEFGAISLIDKDRQWAKAGVNWPKETTLEHSICSHVVKEKREIVVDDLSLDERFATNPHVTGGVRLRRYNGVPLVSSAGFTIGTLCVASRKPGALDKHALLLMRALAREVMHILELRRKLVLGENLLWRSSRLMMLGESAAAIVHEIKNPLAIAMAMVQVLQDPASNESSQKTIPGKLEKMLQRILRIISGVQHFSRSPNHDEFVATAIEKITGDVLEIVRAKAKTMGVEVRTELCTGAVDCRSTQICQVLMNLLNNALDAAKGTRDAWVLLHTEDLGDRISWKVLDSGPGVPENLREKIMEAFFTTKPAGEGTGLGLSLSKKIVQNHGGEFFLKTGGNVTEFCFILPKHHSSETGQAQAV